MRRNDVPEEHVVGDAELGQDTMDDRRARLRRTRARQLPLGRERDAADACAAVAGSFADEDRRRVAAREEVLAEALAQRLRARVLVVRRADARTRKTFDEVGRLGLVDCHEPEPASFYGMN